MRDGELKFAAEMMFNFIHSGKDILEQVWHDFSVLYNWMFCSSKITILTNKLHILTLRMEEHKIILNTHEIIIISNL